MNSAEDLISDSDLVGKIMCGDEDALSILYSRHRRMLFIMLLRILGDRHAAEEVLQDVFLQFWGNAQRFDAARGSLAVWLLVVGRNRAISWLRAHPVRELLEETEGALTNTIASGENIEDGASRTQFAARLRVALRRLPAEQRHALEMAFFEGMTQSEIATETASPLGTVKSRVRTGMQTLRQVLEAGETYRSR